MSSSTTSRAKRKREDSPNRNGFVTFSIPERPNVRFDRVFNASSLEELKNLARKKLKLSLDTEVGLIHIRGEERLVVEDEEDFAAFAESTKHYGHSRLDVDLPPAAMDTTGQQTPQQPQAILPPVNDAPKTSATKEVALKKPASRRPPPSPEPPSPPRVEHPDHVAEDGAPLAATRPENSAINTGTETLVIYGPEPLTQTGSGTVAAIDQDDESEIAAAIDESLVIEPPPKRRGRKSETERSVAPTRRAKTVDSTVRRKKKEDNKPDEAVEADDSRITPPALSAKEPPVKKPKATRRRGSIAPTVDNRSVIAQAIHRTVGDLARLSSGSAVLPPAASGSTSASAVLSAFSKATAEDTPPPEQPTTTKSKPPKKSKSKKSTEISDLIVEVPTAVSGLASENRPDILDPVTGELEVSDPPKKLKSGESRKEKRKRKAKGDDSRPIDDGAAAVDSVEDPTEGCEASRKGKMAQVADPSQVEPSPRSVDSKHVKSKHRLSVTGQGSNSAPEPSWDAVQKAPNSSAGMYLPRSREEPAILSDGTTGASTLQAAPTLVTDEVAVGSRRTSISPSKSFQAISRASDAPDTDTEDWRVGLKSPEPRVSARLAKRMEPNRSTLKAGSQIASAASQGGTAPDQDSSTPSLHTKKKSQTDHRASGRTGAGSRGRGRNEESSNRLTPSPEPLPETREDAITTSPKRAGRLPRSSLPSWQTLASPISQESNGTSTTRRHESESQEDQLRSERTEAANMQLDAEAPRRVPPAPTEETDSDNDPEDQEEAAVVIPASEQSPSLAAANKKPATTKQSASRPSVTGTRSVRPGHSRTSLQLNSHTPHNASTLFLAETVLPTQTQSQPLPAKEARFPSLNGLIASMRNIPGSQPSAVRVGKAAPTKKVRPPSPDKESDEESSETSDEDKTVPKNRRAGAGLPPSTSKKKGLSSWIKQ